MSGRPRLKPAGTIRHKRERPRYSDDSLVRWLALDPALAAGRRPFHAIAEMVARTLGVDCAFIGRLTETTPRTVRALAWWQDGGHREGIEWGDVPRAFPRNQVPGAEGMRSYLAVPLVDSNRTPLGHIGVMDRHPLQSVRHVRRVLSLCAPRVVGEIERLREDLQRGYVVEGPAESGIPQAAAAGGQVDSAGRDGHFTAMLRRIRALRGVHDTRSGSPEGTSRRLMRAPAVTPREEEIVQGLICYRRLSTVADVLGISIHTARNHLKSVFRKLNLHSQDELLRYLFESESRGTQTHRAPAR